MTLPGCRDPMKFNPKPPADHGVHSHCNRIRKPAPRCDLQGLTGWGLCLTLTSSHVLCLTHCAQPAGFLRHSQMFPVSGPLHLLFILLGMNRMIPRSSHCENYLFIFWFLAKISPSSLMPSLATMYNMSPTPS